MNIRIWAIFLLVVTVLAGCTSSADSSQKEVRLDVSEEFRGDQVIANITVASVDGGTLTVKPPEGIRLVKGETQTKIESNSRTTLQYRFQSVQAGGWDIDVNYVERSGLLGGSTRAESTSIWVKVNEAGETSDASLSEVYPNQTVTDID